MDVDGTWRSPEEWPEDFPPLAGWVRRNDGRWRAPDGSSESDIETHVRQRDPQLHDHGVDSVATTRLPKRRSRQAQADRRAILTVMGALGGAALLLAGAIIVITRAGAEVEETRPELPGVIYPAETDAVRLERQREAAALAPEQAALDLEALPVRATSSPTSDGASGGVSGGFDPRDWVAIDEGCLDLAEQVLVERSAVPVTWADQLGCVPDGGRWVDRNLGSVLTRAHEADVVPLVPAEVVHASGGSRWSTATQQAYLTDQRHPATLQIVAAGAGHNPRGQDPSLWRPAAESVWCAYAVDWVAVKSHWQLDVSAEERVALREMLGSCSDPLSEGADPETVVIDELIAPEITFVTAARG